LLPSRIVIDQLLAQFPRMKSHLVADAPIVHNRDFENPVIKIPTNKEYRLTPLEKNTINIFLLAPNAEEEADGAERMARLEEETKAPTAKSKYRSLAHI
jgi:hypothetical protein